jgi:hypothetical protein
MTTVALPVQVSERHPAPARAQTRWTMRLHLPALALWVAVVVVTGAPLLLLDGRVGAMMVDPCVNATALCSLDPVLHTFHQSLISWTAWAVVLIPFGVAAWAGGSLTGRAMETGTAQLAWAWSGSARTWLTRQLVLTAVPVALGTGLLALLHRWAWRTTSWRFAGPWYDAKNFLGNGPLLVALALFGLAAGVLSGLVLRRSLPALAASVAMTGAAFAAIRYALPWMWPTVTRVAPLSAREPQGSGLWMDSGVLTSGGKRITFLDCPYGEFAACGSEHARLGAVGFYTELHPASHEWPLQFMATAVVLLAGAALVLAAYRVLRRTAE